MNIRMRLHRSQLFLCCMVGFIFGVGAGSFIAVPFIWLYTIVLLCAIGVVLFWGNMLARASALCTLFLILGIMRISVTHIDDASAGHISWYNDTAATFIAIIAEEPDVRIDHQRITVSIKNTVIASEHAPVNAPQQIIKGKMLVYAPLYPQFAYGEVLQISCTPKAPEAFDRFAYDRYLERFGVYSICWDAEITSRHTYEGNPLLTSIFSFKARFLDRMQRMLSQPHASLLTGLLVGARQGIPRDLLEAFNRTGLTHIIAISGSNITILVAVLLSIMRYAGMRRQHAFWLLCASIVIFVLFTGATASVVRAGIMGILILAAYEIGRPSRMTNIVALTASAMLLGNPHVLIYDAGFQLSFLSVIGILYVSPRIAPYAARVPGLLGMRDALVATLSAMATTVPFILYLFGRISISAPIANVLVIPVIPITMFFGFIAGVVGMMIPTLGAVVAWPSWLLLEYVIQCARMFSQAPLSSVSFEQSAIPFIIAWYMTLGIVFFYDTIRLKIRRYTRTVG